MRVRLRLLTLSAMLLCIVSTGFAQKKTPVNETDLLNQIREEIRAENDLFKSTMQEIKDVQNRIAALKTSGKPTARLMRLINANNVDSLQIEFNKYAQRIDELLIKNPDDADKLIKSTRTLFGSLPFLVDDLEYYDGALLYYKKSDIRVVSHFSTFLEKYPTSNVSTKALALYLRSMINMNLERQANDQYRSLYSSITSNEISYLLGHIKFSLALDNEATSLFTQLSNDSKYGADSKLMLEFIQTLSEPIPGAIERFKALDSQYTNNPFIVLALARMYVNNSEWKLAEEHYKRFYTLVRDYREINSQYELVLAYLNAGEKDRAVQLLNELLDRKDLGSYYPTLLYLWADIEAENGEFSVALQRFDDFFTFSLEAKKAIEQKSAQLQKIELLKTRLYSDPSPESYELIKKDLLAISDELAAIHQRVLAKASVIPSDVAEQLYKYEIQTILQYKAQFDSYIAANKLRNYPDTDKLATIEKLKESYDLDERAFAIIQTTLDKIISDNYAYQRQVAYEEDIQVAEQVIDVIQQIKQKTTDPVKLEDLDSKIAAYTKKIAENKELLAYYAFDNTLSTLYKESYAEFQQEKKDFEGLYPILEKTISITLPNKLANREMTQIKKEIDSYVASTGNYANVINSLINSLSKSEISVDFVRLQMAYKDLDYRSQQHDKVKNDMSYEQSAAIVNSLKAEKIALKDRFSVFLAKTPQFKYLQQPGGTFLISEANLYYDMAELTYSIDPNTNLQEALVYYEKTNKADPNFYMRDAVLYNIGYIHSTLTKNRIDQQTDDFFANNTPDKSRPDSIRLNEQNLSETLAAYKELVDNYENSRYYDEVVLRLGLIYFNLGADAAEPVVYYAKARDYFNMLIAKDGSRYQYEALYQRGWVYLNGSDVESFKNGLNDFVSILKAINDGKITDQTDIKDYTYTAIKNIAFCLVALDMGDYVNKPKGTPYVLNELNQTTNKEVLSQVIDNAIISKLDFNAPFQAADYIRMKIAIDPLAVNNPTLLDSVFAIYVKYQVQLNPTQDIYAIRDSVYNELKANYNVDSAWYAANKSKQIAPQLKIIKTAYDAIDAKLNNSFVKTPNEQNYAAYNSHIADYRKYEAIIGDSIDAWQLNKDQLKTQFSCTLAERIPTVSNYLQAINELSTFNGLHPNNEAYFNNESGIIKYSEAIYTDLTNADSTSVQFATLPESLSTSDKVFTFYEAAADRFMQVLLSEKYTTKERKLDYVAYQQKLAKLEYDKKLYDAASQRYLLILDQPDAINNVIIRDTYLKLAQIAVEEQKYQDSESWYRKAEPLAVNAQDKLSIHSQVQIQIQSSIEQATGDKDYKKVAQENLRLASEFAGNNEKNRGYQVLAFSAYKQAGEYQLAINVMRELADQATDVSEAFEFFSTSWNVADSLLIDANQATELKTAFMTKYPDSNQTFNLRLGAILKLAVNPANKDIVSEQYLTLFNDVKNKKIIPNENSTPDVLYRSAINVYIPVDPQAVVSTEDKVKRESLMRSYIALYPKDSFVVPYIEILMTDAYNSGDTAKYENIAKELFTLDKTKFQAYKAIAETRLNKVLDTYNVAYAAQDWKPVFSAVDEYNKMEASFIKEGLTFEHGEIKNHFAARQEEYRVIQERNAFLKAYDQKLDAFDAAIKSKRPDQLITVNSRTEWKRHLTGTKENRIGDYKKTVAASINQVQKYLNSVSDKYLDNDRTLRGLNIMARIQEYAAEVIKIQTDKYLASSNELIGLKAQISDDDYITTISNIMRIRDQLVNEHSIEAMKIHWFIYNNYVVPGFSNKYTNYSVKYLADRDLTPRLSINRITYDSSWTTELVGTGTGTNLGSVKQIETANGSLLGSVIVPAGTKLIAKKKLNTVIAPTFGIVNYIFPTPIEIAINGKIIDPDSEIPIDTLTVASPPVVRIAACVMNTDGLWNETENELVVTFDNTSASPLTMCLGVQLETDQRKLDDAIPTEVVEYVTDASWTTYYTDPKTKQAVIAKAVLTDKLGIPVSAIDGYDQSSAKAIWVAENDSLPINNVMFETQININTEYRKGSITFVAPAVATIIINGVPVKENTELAYNDDPLEMYPITLEIAKSNIVAGLNKIQVQVNNTLPYRGFVANISIEKTLKR